jgi:hypothetical protein
MTAENSDRVAGGAIPAAGNRTLLARSSSVHAAFP